jgi:ligand-binding sensor domain-containing protein/two-component sensor histidine kinase
MCLLLETAGCDGTGLDSKEFQVLSEMFARLYPTLRAILQLLLIWSLSTSSLAQVSVQRFTHHVWGIEDGLPGQDIEAITQTSDGFLWLGTPHGLVRFDGYKFVDYGAGLAPVLHEYGVSCLLAARDGSIWVGSLGGGITHITKSAAHTYGLESGLEVLSVRALFQDQDGTLWAGTDHGIYRYSEGRFSHVRRLRDPSIAVIASDGNGGVWFAGHRLIHFADGEFTDIQLPAQKNPKRIRALAMDSSGTLWLGTPYGLLKRAADGVIVPVKEIRSNVRCLLVDRRDQLWIGTVGEGLLIRSRTGHFSDASDADPLPSRVILACASDSSGDLWVGTQAGLVRFSNTGMNLRRIASSRKADYGSLLDDRDGAVWFVSGTLTRLYRGSEKQVHLPELRDLQIIALYREPSGALWVGTLGQGAFRLGSQGEVNRYNAELGTGFVTGFLGAPDGSVWISTNSGVARWAKGSVTSYQTAYGAPHEQVLAMALAAQNGLWIGTSSGLFLLRNGAFSPSDVSTALGHHRVWSLHSESDRSLWIGTESGLYLFSAGRLMRVKLPRAAPVSAVLSIVKDTRGRVLIGQPATIFRLDEGEVKSALSSLPTTKEQRVAELRFPAPPEMFSVAKETGAELYGGLPDTAQADADGGVWYATHLGLLYIAPAPVSRTEAPPPVIIERIAVDGRSQTNRTSITLQASTRNLEIEATPVLLSSRTGLRLRRRLFGLETQWTEIAPGAASIYGKLPPGRYIFRVEANWPNQKQTSVAEINIIQQSSLYRRPWFLVICAIIFGVLIWLYHQFQLHQMRLRFEAVMAERNRVARELHDTVLQGCIGISSLLEAVASSQEQQGIRNNGSPHERWLQVLHYAREQIKETIRDARNAIWELRNTGEEKPLDAALRDLLDRLPHDKGAGMVFERRGPSPAIRTTVQHELVMVIREAVLNALAHAGASRITLRRTVTAAQLLLEVSDDGTGFSLTNLDQKQGRHFGLANMEERVERIGGQFTIDSALGRGTQVRVNLPLTPANSRATDRRDIG